MKYFKTFHIFLKTNLIFFLLQGFLLYFTLFKTSNFNYVHHVSNEIFELSKHQSNLHYIALTTNENKPKLIGFFPNLTTKLTLNFGYFVFISLISIIFNILSILLNKINYFLKILYFVFLQYSTLLFLICLFYGMPIEPGLQSFIFLGLGSISNIIVFNDLLNITNKQKLHLEFLFVFVVVLINAISPNITSFITIILAVYCLYIFRINTSKLLATNANKLSFVFIGVNILLAVLTWL